VNTVLRICIQIEGEEKMAKVEVAVSGAIAKTSQPLAISNTTFALNGTVGVAIPPTQIAQVTGGVQPITFTFDQSLTQKSVADLAAMGLALAEDGNGNISISGTPTVDGPISFGVIATDALGGQVAVRAGSFAH
jgi:hypothetical protein